MGGLAKMLYICLLPLAASPWIMWVNQEEERESTDYFKKFYADNTALMWFVRVFMMIIMSVMASFVGLLVLGGISLMRSLF